MTKKSDNVTISNLIKKKDHNSLNFKRIKVLNKKDSSSDSSEDKNKLRVILKNSTTLQVVDLDSG